MNVKSGKKGLKSTVSSTHYHTCRLRNGAVVGCDYHVLSRNRRILPGSSMNHECTSPKGAIEVYRTRPKGSIWQKLKERRSVLSMICQGTDANSLINPNKTHTNRLSGRVASLVHLHLCSSSTGICRGSSNNSAVVNSDGLD
jgi:hypothetical protein